MTGRSAYGPYGEETGLPSWAGPGVGVPYGFAGARREEAVGLYVMGARWYDPEWGRFLEEDPIGERGGLNLYAYVGSSPVMWVDPTGLNSTPVMQVLKAFGGTARRVGQFIGQVTINGVNTADALTGAANMGAFGWISRMVADAVDDKKSEIAKMVSDVAHALASAAAQSGTSAADADAKQGLLGKYWEMLWKAAGRFLGTYRDEPEQDAKPEEATPEHKDLLHQAWEILRKKGLVQGRLEDRWFMSPHVGGKDTDRVIDDEFRAQNVSNRVIAIGYGKTDRLGDVAMMLLAAARLDEKLAEIEARGGRITDEVRTQACAAALETALVQFPDAAKESGYGKGNAVLIAAARAYVIDPAGALQAMATFTEKTGGQYWLGVSGISPGAPRDWWREGDVLLMDNQGDGRWGILPSAGYNLTYPSYR